MTKIVIQRPPGFEFRSGHYVRISCPALGDDVFHDFTLSSSPQADNLSVHIRAVGPWTRRLRKEISKAVHLPGPLPKVSSSFQDKLTGYHLNLFEPFHVMFHPTGLPGWPVRQSASGLV